VIRVLVADDQEMVRHNLARIIDAEPDLRVVGQAADGVAAIEQARVLRPDVVLADIRMPRKDGLAVARELDVPVVVITTFELDE
jgi:YesN/AraC family two-component response regulator